MECCASLCAGASFCQSAMFDASARTCSLAYVVSIKCSETVNKTLNFTSDGLVVINCIHCDPNGTDSAFEGKSFSVLLIKTNHTYNGTILYTILSNPGCSAAAAAVSEKKADAATKRGSVESTTLTSTSTGSALAPRTTHRKAKRARKSVRTAITNKHKASGSTTTTTHEITSVTHAPSIALAVAGSPGTRPAISRSAPQTAASKKRTRKNRLRKAITITTIAPKTSVSKARITTASKSRGRSAINKKPAQSDAKRTTLPPVLEYFVNASLILLEPKTNSKTNPKTEFQQQQQHNSISASRSTTVAPQQTSPHVNLAGRQTLRRCFLSNIESFRRIDMFP